MTATGMWVEKYRPVKLSEVVNQTEIIGSLEAGMIKEKVEKFSRFAGMVDVPFKTIILDEADEMRNNAQTALRRIKAVLQKSNSYHPTYTNTILNRLRIAILEFTSLLANVNIINII